MAGQYCCECGEITDKMAALVDVDNSLFLFTVCGWCDQTLKNNMRV